MRSPAIERSLLSALCTLGSLSSLAATGCSSDDATGKARSAEEYLGLVEPEEGFQLRNVGTTIPAGADVEYCEVAELPGGPSEKYTVSSVEFGNAPFSHHLGLSAAIAGTPADVALRQLEIGDRVPCLSAETAFGYDGLVSVGGTLQRYSRIDYPDGVGREYHGGQRIVFDYHYYNTSPEDAEARSAVNFHLVEGGTVEHVADTFQFNNWLIDTPPGQSRSFVGECRFRNDVMVGGLTRHTHRWGTDYSVWLAGGEQDGEKLWTSTDWQDDIELELDPPRLMKAGEGFRFQCDYTNTETHSLRFGLNAKDEMCILFGLAWSAGDERELPTQDCDIAFTDADGVGRTAYQGEFPPSTESEIALCLASAGPNGTEPDECERCACNACAGPLLRCATDADCGPILTCMQETPDACLDVVDQHSSGVGLGTQARVCLDASACAMCPDGLRLN